MPFKNWSVHQMCLIKPLKDKKAKIVLNGFIEIANKSQCQPNSLWVNQARDFYNSLRQKMVRR